MTEPEPSEELAPMAEPGPRSFYNPAHAELVAVPVKPDGLELRIMAALPLYGGSATAEELASRPEFHESARTIAMHAERSRHLTVGPGYVIRAA